MIRPSQQWALQIDITNACHLSCSNCTRLLDHARTRFFMSVECFERAVRAVKSFLYESEPCPKGSANEGRRKVIGIIGGEAPQTSDTVRKSTPFSVAADHSGVDVDGFRLYLNGKVLATKTAAETGCAGTACVPTFPVVGGLGTGTYTFYMEAFNADAAASSTTLTLTVTPGPPSAPGQLRIIKSGQ